MCCCIVGLRVLFVILGLSMGIVSLVFGEVVKLFLLKVVIMVWVLVLVINVFWFRLFIILCMGEGEFWVLLIWGCC